MQPKSPEQLDLGQAWPLGLISDKIDFGAASLRRAINGIDGHLSRRQKVEAFSHDERCILRYAPTVAMRSFRLSDGFEVKAGDLVVDLHCWNERVPAMPKGGPDLVWAQRASAGLKRSLRLLATAMVTRPELQDAKACRAKVNFVGQGGSNESVSRIIHRLGFEDVDEGSGSTPARIHDALENILIGLLVWAHNPEALRRDKMIRERRPVWSSRDRLLRLHGASKVDER